jgi:hypothetical protein
MIGTLEDLLETMACGFCGKTKKDGAVILTFAGDNTASSLCFTCFRKQLKFRARSMRIKKPGEKAADDSFPIVDRNGVTVK